MSGLRVGPSLRVVSPSGGSTLITSAPRSPSIWVASGPRTTVVESRMRTPASGPAIAAALLAGPGVLARRRLVQLRAPARTRGDRHVAVADVGPHREQLVAERRLLGVGLHDRDVRDRSAEVQALERREVAVVVVGRDVQLVALGEVGDPARRPEALPTYVDLDHVHRVPLEVRPVLAHRLELLARADRDAHRVLELRERIRVLVVDLHPEEAVGLELAGEAQRLVRLEVHVDVQADVDVGPDRLAHRRDLLDRCRDDVAGRALIVGTDAALGDA